MNVSKPSKPCGIRLYRGNTVGMLEVEIRHDVNIPGILELEIGHDVNIPGILELEILVRC